ncbi:MAG TPA: response regulator [Kofleriaceae bacterium]|nr:response regulator [Kofleriaceae bacterium]
MATVLIVDDEFGLAEMAGELLTILGHSVATAINGKLALAMLDQVRPDVILLDMMMPIMSGPEALHVLKANAEHRDIPVILMSAAGREVVTADLEPLMAGFLQKPFSYQELVAALDRVFAAVRG